LLGAYVKNDFLINRLMRIIATEITIRIAGRLYLPEPEVTSVGNSAMAPVFESFS